MFTLKNVYENEVANRIDILDVCINLLCTTYSCVQSLAANLDRFINPVEKFTIHLRKKNYQ